jgi:hypothetical protein
MDAKALHELAEDLFTKKGPLNSLFQEVAENFFVERADFTTARSMGTDFAADLLTSYPLQCRRSLGDQFSVMLRPTARPWFHTSIRHVDMDGTDNETKAALQWFERTQRRAMYDPIAKFTRATKEGDHDFAAFGQTVISVEINKLGNGMLYRCWHLRDMCWQEDEEGNIATVFRKWKPTAQTLVRMYPKTVDAKVTRLDAIKPFETVECIHMVVAGDMYDKTIPRGMLRWSIVYDIANKTILEETPIWGRYYVIPRWQTVSGSQYAYSPATVCALPDARLIQAMTMTLLEVGEKAANPPIVATQDAIKSDMALYAGGVTYIDADYDERTGDALRPLGQDFRGLTYGVEMNRDTREMIYSAFYLNKLSLPERTAAMTAYEVGQHVQEYVRNALPLFEPMEAEYNAALCDETFDVLSRRGTFGDRRGWPKALQAAEIQFTFESPLHDAIEQQKGQIYQQAQQLMAGAIAIDPSTAFVQKAEVALRDALNGIGTPARWLNSESFVKEAKAAQAQQQEKAQTLAAMQQGSEVAKNLGQAGVMQGGVPVAAPA